MITLPFTARYPKGVQRLRDGHQPVGIPLCIHRLGSKPFACLGELPLTLNDGSHRVDQRQVSERLREVTQMAPAAGVDLLGVELELARGG